MRSRNTDSAVDAAAQAVTSIVRVRYAETDQMGVVYYANYVTKLRLKPMGPLKTSAEEASLLGCAAAAAAAPKPGLRGNVDIFVHIRAVQARLVWFEVGRADWLRAHGWTYRELEAAGVGLPVIEAHCEYRQPTRYDEEVEIVTRATLVSPVRIEFTYAAIRRTDRIVAAVGRTVHAPVDRRGRPCRLPGRIRSVFP